MALGVRHLFAEVRAEAELCWDQLLFRLAAAAHASALSAAAFQAGAYTRPRVSST